MKRVFFGYILSLSLPTVLNSVSISSNFVRYNGLSNISRFLLLIFFKFLKFDFRFFLSALFDCWAIDLLAMELTDSFYAYRFNLNYLFFNFNYSDFRVWVTFPVSMMPSYELYTQITLSNLFWSSNWLEREIYDLFGIRFFGHPDMRRLLTDYGFVGFPLRKDFPLSGYMQVRYDEDLKIVINEPVRLVQKYRYFDFFSTWR